ncbi:MAG TPA: helix-turn-helix domain-containing protein [Lacipirellulaceae bacterium]
MPRTSAFGSLTSLLDRSHSPIYVVDERRRIIYCNAALATWLDLERERIVGRAVEYHSELASEPERKDAPLSDLCPPPRALSGTPCQGTISSIARDGGLAHRHANFVPLGRSQSKSKTGKKHDTQNEAFSGVLVVVDAGDLSPQEVAVELSGEASPDELHRAIRQFRRDQAAKYAIHSLLGESSAMRKVRAQVAAAAASGANVLLYGPAGSGRGHFARAIHYGTGADPGPKLIPVQCEVASDELLRRALDSLRGPGGDPRHRPTLLLEHLEYLTASHQSQLLSAIGQNAIQARIIATCSRHAPHAVAARVGSSATSETLDDDLTDGTPTSPRRPKPDAGCPVPATLDPALVDAISTIAIHIPRLVDRLDDLPILAQSFLESCNVGSAKQVESIRSEALDLLALHSWPGELDELREVIAAAHRSSTSHEITVANLPVVIHHASQAAARIRRRPERIVLDQLLATIEKEAIGRAMTQTGGNKTEAADLLGMTRPRLYRRLVQLGLVPASESELDQPEFIEQDPADDES